MNTGPEFAKTLAKRGYRVFPVQGNKRPIIADWPNQATTDPDTITRLWSTNEWAGVGIATGSGVIVVDLDVKAGEDGVTKWNTWTAGSGVQDGFTIATPSGGKHIYWATQDDTLRNRAAMLPGVDVRATGGYVVAYGDLPSLEDLPELPDAVAGLVRPAQRSSTIRLISSGPSARSGSLSALSAKPLGRAGVQAALEGELAAVREATEGARNAALNTAAFNLGQLIGPLLDMDTVVDQLAAAAEHCGLQPDETTKTIASGIEAGMANPRATAEDVIELTAVDPESDVPPRLDDVNLAEWVAVHSKAMNGEWRWAGDLGWVHWNGRKWEFEDVDGVFQVVREAMKVVVTMALKKYTEPAELKPYLAILSTKKIKALIEQLRAYTRVKPELFDKLHDILVVANGVVSLKTGELMPHDKKRLVTKCTDVEYDPKAKSELWDQCMRALEPEEISWLQVKFGQAITGHTSGDDIVPIMQGSGSNGKSTLLSAIMKASGEYYTPAPMKLLMGNQNDHPTEMMALFGSRLVVVDETPEGQHVDIARLKSIVGQSTITARFIRKDNITWEATHSLFVATNYIPQINETDHGTWRRLRLIKFNQTFPPQDGFREAIKRGEASPAVLAWLVEGAKRWYREDMTVPPASDRITEDTRAWRLESDVILGFASDHLVPDPNGTILASDLLGQFNAWIERVGQRPWSARTLTARLKNHEVASQAGACHSQRRVANLEVSRPQGATGYGGGASGVAWCWSGWRWNSAMTATYRPS